MAKQSSHGGAGGAHLGMSGRTTMVRAAEGEGGGAGGKKPGDESVETVVNRVLSAREKANASKLEKRITEIATAVATATVRQALAAAAGMGGVGGDGGVGGAGDAQVAILLPAPLAERLDRHVERLGKEHPGQKFTRVDAVQTLLDQAAAADERRSGKD